MITKAELLSLSRDELIAHATAAGVPSPGEKTRADLVDTIAGLAPSPASQPPSKARGFFGRARALIAKVVEKGLHLHGAEVLRDAVAIVERTVRAPLPTVTLARIYLSQGHEARAKEVLEQVLALDPTDAEARAFLATLTTASTIQPPSDVGGSATAPPERAAASVTPALEEVQATPIPDPPPSGPVVAVDVAALAPQGSGPKSMLDDAPLPVRYGVDEAVVMVVDPTTAYLYWEVRPETVARLRERAPQGRLVVRLELEIDGATVYRHVYPEAEMGDVFLERLPDGAILRASLGFLDPRGFFPVAEGQETATPPATRTDHLSATLASWSREHTALLPPPLPAALALSIALAHTTDPSLRPQLAVLAGLPGFSVVLPALEDAVLDGGRADPPEDEGLHAAVLPSRFRESRSFRVRLDAGVPWLAVGSSDLLLPSAPMGPLGSSELSPLGSS